MKLSNLYMGIIYKGNYAEKNTHSYYNGRKHIYKLTVELHITLTPIRN